MTMKDHLHKLKLAGKMMPRKTATAYEDRPGRAIIAGDDVMVMDGGEGRHKE